MKALYDKNVKLVGWLQPGEHIFDVNLNWVAFISNGHAWSSKTGNWLGPINGLICLDQYGKVVLWNPDQSIAGTAPPIRPVRAIRAIQPIRPIQPILPIQPIQPIQPVGGWSRLSFPEYLNQS